MGTNVRVATVVLVAFGLQGCVLFGRVFLTEGRVTAQLHNPTTHETATCGEGMHKGLGWSGAVEERDACISDHEAKGFVLDSAEPPIQKDRHGRVL